MDQIAVSAVLANGLVNRASAALQRALDTGVGIDQALRDYWRACGVTTEAPAS